jgi:hypothetical protein
LTSNAHDVAESTLDRFEDFADRVEEEKDRAVREAQEMGKDRVPVDQGDLRDDISVDLDEDKVYNTLEYAPAIDRGSEPHTITPTDADALHFYWEKKGEKVTFQAVEHPGTEPTFYLQDSARDAFRDSIDRLTK